MVYHTAADNLILTNITLHKFTHSQWRILKRLKIYSVPLELDFSLY